MKFLAVGNARARLIAVAGIFIFAGACSKETPPATDASLPNDAGKLVVETDSGVVTDSGAATVSDASADVARDAGPRYGCARCNDDEYCVEAQVMRRGSVGDGHHEPPPRNIRCKRFPTPCEDKLKCACQREPHNAAHNASCKMVGGQVQVFISDMTP